MINDRRLVTIKKACELASVSRRTIYNWMQDGKIECLRTAGGCVRIYIDSLFKAPAPTPSKPKLDAPILRAHNLPPFPQGPLVVPSERAEFGVENPAPTVTRTPAQPRTAGSFRPYPPQASVSATAKLPMAKASLR